MKKIAIASCLLFVCSLSGAAFAQTKAVVIPLGSKSSGLQHYRIASQTGTSTIGCETVSFSTPDAEVQAVLSSNFSIQPTSTSLWWSNIKYSTDGGVVWNDVNNQVTVSGALAGVTSNTSENAVLDLAPNSNYKFRIGLFAAPTLSTGQCELFITFNAKDTANIVTPAAAATVKPAEAVSGPGTSNVE